MGFNGNCIDCCKLFYTRLKNLPGYDERRKSYTNKVRENVMLHSAKKRALKKGFEFNLDKSDIVIPEICPILGIPIDRNADNYSDNAPSLDRTDNTKGYIKGNVCVVSWRANRIKSDATLEELEKIICYAKSKGQLVHH